MIQSIRTRAFLACALFIGITGCASDSGQDQTASPEGKDAVPAAADPNSDPLERIPDSPFTEEMAPDEVMEYLKVAQENQKKEWEAAGWGEPGPLIQLGADQEGVDLTEGFRTVYQVVWVGAERDTVFNGPAVETVRGSIKDIEHFVAPASIESYMAPAREALEYLESKEAGNDPVLPEGTDYSYKLHPGKIVSSASAASDADKAAWPEYAKPDENGKETVWLGIPDQYGNSENVPVMHGAEAKVADFNIWAVEDAPAEQDSTHAVIVYSTAILRTQLADERPVEMHLSLKYQVGLEGNDWMIQANEWNVDVINADVVGGES